MFVRPNNVMIATALKHDRAYASSNDDDCCADCTGPTGEGSSQLGTLPSTAALSVYWTSSSSMLFTQFECRFDASRKWYGCAREACFNSLLQHVTMLSTKGTIVR